jgi:hypothetical protein
LGILTRPTMTKTRAYLLLNMMSYGVRFVFFSGFTYTIALSVSEQRFVARNPTVTHLVKSMCDIGREIRLQCV